MFLKIRKCFKIPRIWQKILILPFLFDMHFSQKLQWVLLLQDCFNAHDKNIASDKGHFEDFPKEKGRFFIMPCFTFWYCFVTFCHASPDIFCSKDKNFRSTIVSLHFGAKGEIYYSSVTIHLLLFMTLFTSNFCLFKGDCPLYFKQVFSVLSLGLLS